MANLITHTFLPIDLPLPFSSFDKYQTAEHSKNHFDA